MINKPVKLLITHQNPDQDAIGAIWLFMKWGGELFEAAQYYFVNAGEEIGEDILEAKQLSRDEVVHVDTGLGPFDHHQPDNTQRDSATLRVYEFLLSKQSELNDDKALKRLVWEINEGDHFASCYWPDANHDRYGFILEEILKGLRSGRQFNDREIVEFGMICLDGVYNSLRVKVKAQEELKTLGVEFESKWGRALMIENSNDEVVKVAQKEGVVLVVRKDKESGHVRIKAVPDKGVDLTRLYELVKSRDKMGTWYLHPSKSMLLNGSSRNEKHVATPLSLMQVVEIVKQA